MLPLALTVAFLGCGLLFCGALLLVIETSAGIRATDRRFEAILELCGELSRRSREAT
jgi:hypothetical protein